MAGQVLSNPPSDVTLIEPDVGGKIKLSNILGTVAGVSGSLGALGAPLALPIAAIAGIGSSIAKLFGGGLTQKEVDMLMHIKSRVDHRRNNGVN